MLNYREQQKKTQEGLMNTATWILFGLTTISLILYFIFTFGKKINIIQAITSTLPIILIGTLNLLFLKSYIPDSYHIMELSILAFTFASITQVLTSFGTTRNSSIASGISFLLSVTSWIILYKSVFYIYRVPVWINIMAASSYFLIFLLLFLIFLKKQKFTFYLFAILSVILISFLHYCTFVSLCFLPASYNVIKFIAVTILMGYIVFGLLNNSIINIKLKNMINFLSLLVSFTLISFSNILILN